MLAKSLFKRLTKLRKITPDFFSEKCHVTYKTANDKLLTTATRNLAIAITGRA